MFTKEELSQDPIFQAHARSMARLEELDNPSGLHRQMIMTTEVMKAHGGAKDFRYRTFYDMVLELGEEKHVEKVTIPDGFEAGRPKSCYVNAAMLAMTTNNLTYVEGYAATDDLGISMSHAWVEDEDGNIIDVTWGALEHVTGASYYGIKFSTEYLMKRWDRHPDRFGGVLGEDYGYHVHLEHGVVCEHGVVTGDIGSPDDR